MSKIATVRTVRTGADLAVLAACLFGLTGCATMINGVSQNIPVSTMPPGATVEVNGVTHETPCVLPLSRARDHRLVISKLGYRTEQCNIVRQPGRKTLGNVYAGGLIGLGVDAMSGANNELVPSSVNLQLARAEQPGPAVTEPPVSLGAR